MMAKNCFTDWASKFLLNSYPFNQTARSALNLASMIRENDSELADKFVKIAEAVDAVEAHVRLKLENRPLPVL
jgi:hypothetical protein